MSTIPLVDPQETSGEIRQALEEAARSRGTPLEEVTGINQAMMYWPEYLRANLRQSRETYKRQGALAQLTKECMHVAVSGANDCRY